MTKPINNNAHPYFNAIQIGIESGVLNGSLACGVGSLTNFSAHSTKETDKKIFELTYKIPEQSHTCVKEIAFKSALLSSYPLFKKYFDSRTDNPLISKTISGIAAGSFGGIAEAVTNEIISSAPKLNFKQLSTISMTHIERGGLTWGCFFGVKALLDQQFGSDKSLESAMAKGALAGHLSERIAYPLTSILNVQAKDINPKTTLQTAANILKEQGADGLYNNFWKSAGVRGIFVGAGIAAYFYLMNNAETKTKKSTQN